MRVLPPDVPHVPPVGRGDGLAPRPDPADGDRTGGRSAHLHHGRALRRVPGVHGLRDGVPLGGQVRPLDRSHPPAGRTAPPPIVRRSAVPRVDLRPLPVPTAPPGAAGAAPLVPAARRGCFPAASGAVPPPAGPTAGDGVAAARPTDASARPARVHPRPGRRAPERGPALRLRPAGRLPRGERRDRSSPRGRRVRGRVPAGPGMLRRAVGARGTGGRSTSLRPCADRSRQRTAPREQPR